MNTNEIQVLLTLKETPSFQEAARRLGISRTSISRTLQSLEQQYHGPFFIHERQGIRWTPTGTLVLEAAETMARLIESLQEDLHPETTGILQIENQLSCWPDFLYALPERCQGLCPSMRIEFLNRPAAITLCDCTIPTDQLQLPLGTLNVVRLSPHSDSQSQPGELWADPCLTDFSTISGLNPHWIQNPEDWLGGGERCFLVPEPQIPQWAEDRLNKEVVFRIPIGLRFYEDHLSQREREWIQILQESLPWN